MGDFNNPLTPMDPSTKQKISKETQTLNDTMDQLYPIDIYRTFYAKNKWMSHFLKCTRNILHDRAHSETQSLGELKKKKLK